MLLCICAACVWHVFLQYLEREAFPLATLLLLLALLAVCLSYLPGLSLLLAVRQLVSSAFPQGLLRSSPPHQQAGGAAALLALPRYEVANCRLHGRLRSSNSPQRSSSCLPYVYLERPSVVAAEAAQPLIETLLCFCSLMCGLLS